MWGVLEVAVIQVDRGDGADDGGLYLDGEGMEEDGAGGGEIGLSE